MTTPIIKTQYQEMVAYGESIQSHRFTVPEFTQLLREFIGSNIIKVKTSRDKTISKNQVVVGGSYDPEEDAANCPSIIIYITYSSDQKRISIKDINWPQLCLDLIECSGHEIIHQTQYRLREFDVGPNIFVSLSPEERKRTDQEYLGNPDEIEAYGYSIAVDVFLKYSPKTITIKHISKSAMFKMYVSAFGREHNVVGGLLSYIVKYYEAISEENHAKKSEELATE